MMGDAGVLSPDLPVQGPFGKHLDKHRATHNNNDDNDNDDNGTDMKPNQCGGLMGNAGVLSPDLPVTRPSGKHLDKQNMFGM